MKTVLLFLALFFLAGCLNIYTRFPGTKKEIYTTYQCTQEMWAWTYVTAFPQVLASEKKFYAVNIVSVPIAIVPAIDTCLEGVVDTICWPIDYCFTSQK